MLYKSQVLAATSPCAVAVVIDKIPVPCVYVAAVTAIREPATRKPPLTYVWGIALVPKLTSNVSPVKPLAKTVKPVEGVTTGYVLFPVSQLTTISLISIRSSIARPFDAAVISVCTPAIGVDCIVETSYLALPIAPP